MKNPPSEYSASEARSARPEDEGALGRRGEGFPKSAHLLKHADFDRVYKQGRRHFSASMTVFWLRRETGAGPRIGFTVGKVMGGAVVRNRMRRRTREAVRRSLDALPSAVDVVINPRKTVVDAPFDKLLGEVRAAFVAVEGKLK